MDDLTLTAYAEKVTIPAWDLSESLSAEKVTSDLSARIANSVVVIAPSRATMQSAKKSMLFGTKSVAEPIPPGKKNTTLTETLCVLRDMCVSPTFLANFAASIACERKLADYAARGILGTGSGVNAQSAIVNPEPPGMRPMLNSSESMALENITLSKLKASIQMIMNASRNGVAIIQKNVLSMIAYIVNATRSKSARGSNAGVLKTLNVFARSDATPQIVAMPVKKALSVRTPRPNGRLSSLASGAYALLAASRKSSPKITSFRSLGAGVITLGTLRACASLATRASAQIFPSAPSLVCTTA